MTQIDLGNIRINWRGSYDALTAYVSNDAVAYQGSSFVAKRAVTGVVPAQGADWDLMAAGTDQLTTEGDLLVHDGAVPSRLPRGNDSQVLQMVGNQPTWLDQSLDPARKVQKLQKVNQHGSWYTRYYLMADGTVRGCGYGGTNYNGDVSGSHVYTPSRISFEDNDVRFVEVFSGGGQHYALTASGEVWSWGFNNYGQLGHGDTTNRAIGKRIEFFVDNNIQIATVIPNWTNYYDYGNAYFLTTDGKLYAVGYGGNGNMGVGTTANQYTPVRCGALENIVHVAASGLPYSVFAVESDGTLWVWGWNYRGCLGLGDATQRTSPVLQDAFTNVSKVVTSAGYTTNPGSPEASSYILTTNGELWAAGYNGYGQLGLGDTTNRSAFAQIVTGDTFVDVVSSDARYGAVAALNDQGEILTWGYNGNGQLGKGDTSGQYTPHKPVGAFQGSVTKIKIGGGNSQSGIVLQAGNDLWASGYNGNGNLCVGYTSSINTFDLVKSVSGNIADWGIFGTGRSQWGIGVLYDDGRVDAGGYSGYGETGTQTGNIHSNSRLTNVIF